VGWHIADVLSRMDVCFVMIEFDSRQVAKLKKKGFPIIFGDASQEVILEAVNIKKARLMLVTTPANIVSRAIVDRVKKMHSTLHMVTRSQSLEQMKIFQEKGVYHIVQPEFEAGLEFTRQALLHLELPLERIHKFTDDVRQEHYRPLIKLDGNYKALAQLENSARLFQLTWITINPDSPLIGLTIEQSDIRKTTGVNIAGILRKGELISNPGADFILALDDSVGVIGKQDQLGRFCKLSNSLGCETI